MLPLNIFFKVMLDVLLFLTIPPELKKQGSNMLRRNDNGLLLPSSWQEHDLNNGSFLPDDVRFTGPPFLFNLFGGISFFTSKLKFGTFLQLQPPLRQKKNIDPGFNIYVLFFFLAFCRSPHCCIPRVPPFAAPWHRRRQKPHRPENHFFPSHWNWYSTRKLMFGRLNLQ